MLFENILFINVYRIHVYNDNHLWIVQPLALFEMILRDISCNYLQ